MTSRSSLNERSIDECSCGDCAECLERWAGPDPTIVDEKEKTSKIVMLWAEKGGVGKTTTTYAFGKSLAAKGFSTMMVDLDSQVNLTQLVLPERCATKEDLRKLQGESFHTAFWQYFCRLDLPLPKEEAEAAQRLEDQSAKKAGRSPLPIYALPTPSQVCVVVLTPLSQVSDNLWVLPGDFTTSDMDQHITTCVALSPIMPAVSNIFGVVRTLLERIALQVKADYILLDCSPGAGSFNHLLLFSSDFWVMVLKQEFFSVVAVENVTARLFQPPVQKFLDRASWLEEASKLSRISLGTEGKPGGSGACNFPFHLRKPHFMGAVLNDVVTATKWDDEIGRALEALQSQLRSVGWTTESSATLLSVPRARGGASFPFDKEWDTTYGPLFAAIAFADFSTASSPVTNSGASSASSSSSSDPAGRHEGSKKRKAAP